jgi:hypothetical protein
VPVETIAKRTAWEFLSVFRMGLRNVARSGRMKPDWAATLKATKGYVCALPRFFNRHGYPFQSPLAGGIDLPHLHLAS